MGETGKLTAHPLFVGLTRPPMFLGVSYIFAVLNSLLCMLIFVNTSSLYTFVQLVINHMIGYIICFKEPLFLELFMVRMQKCNRCKNRLFHGANSYDFY